MKCTVCGTELPLCELSGGVCVMCVFERQEEARAHQKEWWAEYEAGRGPRCSCGALLEPGLGNGSWLCPSCDE
jgi:predicted RNA-binding Zn-ribbon protein involved in translation (DUF1610 family)